MKAEGEMLVERKFAAYTDTMKLWEHHMRMRRLVKKKQKKIKSSSLTKR